MALTPLVAVFYFLYKNDAPITQGHIEFHVPYKKDKPLDIYYPTQTKFNKSPVLLFIHGGAWIAGRKESINLNRFNGAINDLRDSGYTIISPEYALAKDGKTPFPECIIDGFDAINWIENHADSLNLDLNNFGIMGESAGAHIAMMNTFSKPENLGLTHKSTDLDYLIDIYGPNDLWNLYHSTTIDSVEKIVHKLPSSIQEDFDIAKVLFGFDPEKDSLRALEFTNRLSPINYLSIKVPPTLIIHGDKDILVPIEQSINLQRKLDSLNVANELHILKDVNHAFAGASKEEKDSIQTWISNFVIQQYNEN